MSMSTSQECKVILMEEAVSTPKHYSLAATYLVMIQTFHLILFVIAPQKHKLF